MRLVRAFGLSVVVFATPALAFAQGGARAAAPLQIGPFGSSPDATVPKGTAVVLGQVVDAGSGQAIAEAIVSIRINAPGLRGGGPAAGGGRGAGARGQGAAATQPAAPDGPRIPATPRFITDANGHFVVRDLPKGSISYSVDAPGYFGVSSSRSIDEGERVRDLKLTMQKYAVITGTILDDVGDPAVNVTVRAMQRDRSGFSQASEDKTDDRGIYRLAGLHPGDYAIAVPQTQVTMPVATFDSMMRGLMGGGGSSDLRDLATSAAGFSATNGLRVGDLQVGSSSGLTPVMTSSGQIFVAPTMFYPSAATPGAATIVKVASGEERAGIDMQTRVVPTAKVSGTIAGPAGAGMMQVQLRPVTAEADQTNIDVATTVASANGGFTFLGVPVGQYVVRIVREPPPQLPPELASNPFMQMAMGSRTGALQTMMFAQAPVNVSGGDVSGIALTLTPGLTVSGHVVFDGTSPKPDANALAAMSVQLAPRESGPNAGGNTRVNNMGNFKTGGAVPGHYDVNMGSASAPWVLLSLVADGRNVLQDGLDLSGDVTGLVATFTDRAASMTGTVRASSTPPEDVTVFVLPVDLEDWIANGMNPRRTYQGHALTGGTFSIGRILPGEYSVVGVSGPVAYPASADFYRLIARSATKVTIALGDHPTVDAPLVKIQ